MVFENIEQLKSEFTDKYVVVDERYPELQRFKGHVGAVKTVNMSGRALVQFEMDNNIGWYDIDLAFLKVVDAPPPKEEAEGRKKAAPADKPGFKSAPAKGKPAPEALEKPIGEAKPTAPAAPAAPAKAGGAMSTSDILAAARGKAAAPAAAKPAAPAAGEPGKKLSVEEILAAARREKPTGGTTAAPAPAAAKPAAPPASKPAVDAKKMSVADILAAARGEKQAAPATPPSTPAAEAPASQPAPAAEPEPEPAPTEAVAAAPAAAAPTGERKRVQLATIEEMLAYCRRVDAKG